MKKTRTKLLSMLLTLCMVAGLLPTGLFSLTANAAETNSTPLSLTEPIGIDEREFNNCFNTWTARTLTGMNPTVTYRGNMVTNIRVEADTTAKLMTALYWAQYYRDKTEFRYNHTDGNGNPNGDYNAFVPADNLAKAVEAAAPGQSYDYHYVYSGTTFTIDLKADMDHDIDKKTWGAGDTVSRKAYKLGLTKLDINHTMPTLQGMFKFLDTDVVFNLNGHDAELCLMDCTYFINLYQGASFSVQSQEASWSTTATRALQSASPMT